MTIALKSLLLFIALLIPGYFLAYLVYSKSKKKFVGSDLFKKTLLWIPIFFGFMIFVAANNALRLAIILAMCGVICVEASQRLKSGKHRLLVVMYVASICVALLCALAVGDINQDFLYVIAFSSVLSDVFAYFFGNFFGRHHLPISLNNNKSYEGVIGQVVGAFTGVVLSIAVLGVHVNVLYFVPIGLGAIVGDLFNSYVKRKLNIKDWGTTLPGHGGFIDRFASLGYSFAFTLIIIKIAQA